MEQQATKPEELIRIEYLLSFLKYFAHPKDETYLNKNITDSYANVLHSNYSNLYEDLYNEIRNIIIDFFNGEKSFETEKGIVNITQHLIKMP